MYDDKAMQLERVVLDYLASVGCSTGIGKDGAHYVRFPKRLPQMKPLADEFGARCSLKAPGLLRRIAAMAVAEGAWSHVAMRLDLADEDLLDVCRRHAEYLGLELARAPGLGIRRQSRPLLLVACVASLFTHSRADRLICLVSGPGAPLRRVPSQQVRSALATGRSGWLARCIGTAEPDMGLAESASPDWISRYVSEAILYAHSLARGLLWRAGRLSRSLMAEELRLIEGHYCDLSQEVLEPMRRLHMRISAVNERRSDTRSTRAAQATAAQFRRLKGQMGEEESHLQENREELIREREDRIQEVRGRYAPKARVELRLAALVDVEVPVLSWESLEGLGRLSLTFNPFSGAPARLEWGGGVLAIGPDTRLVVCSAGHIHDTSRDPICSCCAGVAHHQECARCGIPACDGCLTQGGDEDGLVCDECLADERLESRAFSVW